MVWACTSEYGVTIEETLIISETGLYIIVDLVEVVTVYVNT